MKKHFAALLAACLLPAAAMSATYTYTYKGPNFSSNTDHVEVVFTTSAPLTPSTKYTDVSQAGIISAATYVITANGTPVAGFNGLPVTGGNFMLNTDATASATNPGIESWHIFGGANNLQGSSPTMTGSDYQAYSMNSLKSIPGSVTGPYAYDQGTVTTYYTSCNGVAGCQLAGNGQPYTTGYAARTTVNSSSANWSMKVNSSGPTTPAALVVSGNLPSGVVGQPYSGSLSVNGGTAPYNYSATSLPPGLSIAPSTGVISGTPTLEGVYNTQVTVKDNAAPVNSMTVTKPITIVAASPALCVKPAVSRPAAGKGIVTLVGKGYIVVGLATVRIPACAVISYNGAKGFKVGQKVEYEGFTSDSTGTVGVKVTVN
ncbi:MAG: Ig domain-containing protein [Limnobacter sp.]|uniref:Ig domain-containing protein n=1 Tax=Limnobacter sp. TaxID=2003368 RepID=UPI00391A7FF0